MPYNVTDRYNNAIVRARSNCPTLCSNETLKIPIERTFQVRRNAACFAFVGFMEQSYKRLKFWTFMPRCTIHCSWSLDHFQCQIQVRSSITRRVTAPMSLGSHSPQQSSNQAVVANAKMLVTRWGIVWLISKKMEDTLKKRERSQWITSRYMYMYIHAITCRHYNIHAAVAKNDLKKAD